MISCESWTEKKVSYRKQKINIRNSPVQKTQFRYRVVFVWGISLFCWRPSYIELLRLAGMCLINTNIHYWLIRVAVGEWINENFCWNEQNRQQWWGLRKPFICGLVFCRFLSHTEIMANLNLRRVSRSQSSSFMRFIFLFHRPPPPYLLRKYCIWLQNKLWIEVLNQYCWLNFWFIRKVAMVFYLRFKLHGTGKGHGFDCSY